MPVKVICDGDCIVDMKDRKILLSNIHMVIDGNHAVEFDSWLEFYAKLYKEPADPCKIIRSALVDYLEGNHD